MVLEVTHNEQLLTVKSATALEIKQLGFSLTKKLDTYNFLPEVIKMKWDGITSYFHKKKYIPIGLWQEVKNICNEYDFEIEIEGLDSIFYNIDFEEFKSYVDNKFKDAVNADGVPFIPKTYQIQSAYHILTNRYCLNELATAAGKSLIIFIVLSYLHDKNLSKKMLIVVPSIDLVIQMYENFNEYNSFLKKENISTFVMKQIHGGETKDFKSNQNIHISTYQSLNNFKESYFESFDTVCVDEVHSAKCASIKKVLQQCVNSNRRFGVTGTLPKKNSLDLLTLQAYLGPVTFVLKAKNLQDTNDISNVEIKQIHLHYNSAIKSKFDNLTGLDRMELLNVEKKFINQYNERLEFICGIISKISKNQLVLFHKIEYGNLIYKTIKELYPNKEVFLINGSINSDDRTDIFTDFETGENKIGIFSFGTSSTGINLRNVHYIHLVESFKSDSLIRQTIGRGLRKHKNKSKLVVIDYVDILTSESKFAKSMNMLQVHGKARCVIYNEQEFKYSKTEYNLK